MSGTLVSAAAFGVGLLSGAGLVALTQQKPDASSVPYAASSSSSAAGPVPLQSTAVVPSTSKDMFKFGPMPGPIADLLTRDAYVTAYDRQKRHPAWTAEHLTAEGLKRQITPGGSGGDGGANRSNSTFKEDPSIAPIFQSKLADYFRSGYDRGHLVPAANAKRNQTAMDETFYLTNIAPQVGEGFNRSYWAWFEDFGRRLTGQFSNVFIFTVPLYLPKLEADGKWRVSYEVIGNPPNVSVPTHWAKVILTAQGGMPGQPGVKTSLGAFAMPNAVIPDEEPLTKFLVPVEAVEKAAGLTLFSPALKASSNQLCQSTRCELIIRKFDDANKKIAGGSNQGQRLLTDGRTR